MQERLRLLVPHSRSGLRFGTRVPAPTERQRFEYTRIARDVLEEPEARTGYYRVATTERTTECYSSTARRQGGLGRKRVFAF